MMRRFLTAGALVLGAALVPSRATSAQAVLGVGDDALTIPRGVFRLWIQSGWTASNERYGQGTDGRPTGALEPLGIDLNLDTLGAAQLRSLQPLQTSLRTLTGQSDFAVSLGKTVFSTNDQVTAVPVTIEAGLTSRLSFSVTVPLVKTHVNIFFQANPAGREGNVGFNPAAGTAADVATKSADSAFAAQMVALATQVQTYCTTNPSAAQCATGAALAASAITFGNTLGQVYTTSQFVPVSGSSAQQTIDARAASYKTTLNSLATLVGGTPITGAGVIGAPNVPTTNDIQTLIADPAYGISAEPLQSVDHWGLGDIELGVKLMLLDPFGGDRKARMQPSGIHARFAVGGMLRFPTGKTDDPNMFFDIAAGTHEFAFGPRAYGDFLFGRHFWTSVVARYDIQVADNRIMRITTPDAVLAPAYTEAMVSRQLGNTFELEATPRWVLNDFMSISAQYVYRHKAADRYTGTPYSVSNLFTGGDTVVVDPATLDLETAQTEHRVGGGISFSNLRAVSLGKARIPFEVSFQHLQTTNGYGGNVPRLTIDRVQLRVYANVFGH